MTFTILPIADLTDEDLIKHARRLRTKKGLGRIDPREEQQLAFINAEGERRARVKREQAAEEARRASLREFAAKMGVSAYVSDAMIAESKGGN